MIAKQKRGQLSDSLIIQTPPFFVLRLARFLGWSHSNDDRRCSGWAFPIRRSFSKHCENNNRDTFLECIEANTPFSRIACSLIFRSVVTGYLYNVKVFASVVPPRTSTVPHIAPSLIFFSSFDGVSHRKLFPIIAFFPFLPCHKARPVHPWPTQTSIFLKSHPFKGER